MSFNPIEAMTKFFQGRIYAYSHVFHPSNQYADIVLRDLAKFCRANESTFAPDPRAHAVLEGRREVWLRIQEHLQLTPEQMYALHPVKNIKANTEVQGVSATQMNRSQNVYPEAGNATFRG